MDANDLRRETLKATIAELNDAHVSLALQILASWFADTADQGLANLAFRAICDMGSSAECEEACELIARKLIGDVVSTNDDGETYTNGAGTMMVDCTEDFPVLHRVDPAAQG